MDTSVFVLVCFLSQQKILFLLLLKVTYSSTFWAVWHYTRGVYSAQVKYFFGCKIFQFSPLLVFFRQGGRGIGEKYFQYSFSADFLIPGPSTYYIQNIHPCWPQRLNKLILWIYFTYYCSWDNNILLLLFLCILSKFLNLHFRKVIGCFFSTCI